MAYSKYGKVEADDLGVTLLGAATSTTSTNINTVWSTGNGKSGVGQPVLTSPSQNGKIIAAQWATIISSTTSLASHQGTPVTAIAVPGTGSPVVHYAALPTNIAAVYTGRNNAALQGSSTTVTTTNATTWYNYLTFTQTITFASGDAARYFFNAGGQIALTFAHPTGSGINGLFNVLGTSCGTLVISSPNTGTVSIVASAYNGINKVGGAGTVTTLLPNVGYWGLTTTNQEVFKQFGGSFTNPVPGGGTYSQNFLSVNVKTNGPQGSNGDNGSIITVTTTWDEVPNGLTTSAGTAVAVTLKPPSTTYIANTWGTPAIAGTVTGQ
jgi:hypothetical protein